MRPLRLELRGFTAFREPAVLDLDGRRLFAITGPTGAGKSSLLDAMTWALYGEVPRVGRATRQLITHGARSMAARLDFSVRGERYRVSRQAPGSIGARLERQREDGGWEPLADRAREVTARVSALLGLDYQTFTKTVLLPQGAFDTFLRGDEPQRREILSRLLGLDRYAEVGRAARNRAAGAGAAASMLRTEIERFDAASPEAIVALEADHTALAAHARLFEERGVLLTALAATAEGARAAEGAASGATDARAAGEAALESTERAAADALRAAEEATAGRDGVAGELAALRYDAEEHRRLERQAEQFEQRAAAGTALDRAEGELREAEALAERAAEQAAGLEAEASRVEATLVEAKRERQAGRQALEAATGVALATERALGEQAQAAERERAAAEAEAAASEDEARRLSACDERLRAQQQAVASARGVLAEATAAREATAGAAEAASAHLREAEHEAGARAAALEAAQLQDAALTLQRSLAPGDPCPVCGKPVEHVELHPAPALDAARDAREEATRTLDQARGEHGAAAAALAAAVERAAQSGSALEQAERDLAGLREQVSAAGADPDALEVATAQAAAAIEAERARAARAAAAEASALDGERALGLLRASIGEELDVEPADAGELHRVRTALEQAIRGDRERAAALVRTEAASHGAGEAARERAAGAARASERREHAALAVERALQQLASLGAPGAEQGAAEAIRAALLEASARAARHGALEAALRAAEQACASAAARAEAVTETSERAAEAVQRLASEAVAALAAADEARGRLDAAWRAAAAAEPSEQPRAALVPQLLADHEAAHRACAAAQGAAAERLEASRAAAARAAEMRLEASRYDDGARLAGALEQELHRNRFIAYVQREAMQLLAADAAERLLQLSSGRYRLAADGDEFVVVDRLNGDERRSVKTLSGGETFLASLALALALSERLPEIAGRGGAMSLESLFLDEGFGALDQESLDVAIGGLEVLAGGRRLVGVISHLPEVADRLSDRIEVVKTGATSSLRDTRASGRRTPAAVGAGSAEAPDPHDGVRQE